MVKAMAVEFARCGVRAHSILPGWIETNMTANAVNTEGFKTKVLPRVPMRCHGCGHVEKGSLVVLHEHVNGTSCQMGVGEFVSLDRLHLLGGGSIAETAPPRL